jgi:hypothetical protein
MSERLSGRCECAPESCPWRRPCRDPAEPGIAIEQQESIGEMMRTSGGHVITRYEFRQRLLALPGWEQFTALMTFFLTEDDNVAGRPRAARLAAKIDYEVTATIDALHVLITTLGELTSRSDPLRYRQSASSAMRQRTGQGYSG